MMMTSLGAGETTFNFESGYVTTFDPCASDTSLWRVIVDDQTKRCYYACSADVEGTIFEIDCPAGAAKTAGATVVRRSTGSIISGIPDWAVILGGVAVLVMVTN